MYDGKKYEIVKESKNWSVAAACAVERGGYLVEINSLGEQNAIFSEISKAGISINYKPINDGGGTSYLWIGATDKYEEGKWIWDGKNSGDGVNFWNGQGAGGSGNGKAVDGKFVNWGGASTGTFKEPDDYFSNQDAAAMALSGWPSGTTFMGIAGEWNDISIQNEIYYIIEYDAKKSKLKVNKGNNSGEYAVGEQVTVTADPPAGNYVFSVWIGDIEYLSDPGKPTTIVTMPDKDIEITATYRPISSVDDNNLHSKLFFPNPVHETINFDENLFSKNIEIFSIFGELVISQNIIGPINLSSLSSGLYIGKINEIFFKILKV